MTNQRDPNDAQEVYTDADDNVLRQRQTVPPEDAGDPSGQPRAQPEGAQSDSAPVTPQRAAAPSPAPDTRTAPGAGDGQDVAGGEGTDEADTTDADADEAELQAEMERRHRIAMRLRKSARQAPKNDPETAELRQEAGRMASAPNIPKPYTVGKWGDLPNYQCNVPEVDGGLCPHATLSEEGAWMHYVGSHIRQQRLGADEMLDDEDELDEEE